MLDLLIRDALVYDGTGNAGQPVSVGIQDGRIAWIGEPPSGWAAREVISAPGMLLCPGFIDSHASTGLGYLLPGPADHKLLQGVTTEVIGNCGSSEAPIGTHGHAETQQRCAPLGIPVSWDSCRSWMATLDAQGLPINLATHVGHTSLRKAVGAWEPALTPPQRTALTLLLRQAMDAGVLGLSTGLIYAPGCFAPTEELIHLARITAEAGGIYVSHIRDERHGLLDAIDEALHIGHEANLPVLISHLKAAERPNWGRLPAAIDRIVQARRRGQAATFAVYPYTAVSTRLRAFFPPRLLRGGADQLARRLQNAQQEAVAHLHRRGTDFEALTLITESLPGSRGQTIAHIARTQGIPPAMAAIQVLTADPDAWVVYHCIDPEDMEAALLWPDAIVCSDSWSYPVNAPHPIGDPHPRTFGAFTRFIERYGLAAGKLPLGQAIRKVTALPADWLGLRHRGRIAVGFAADLVLLDPERVRERATYDAPRQLSEGTVQVWVNGTAMLSADGTVLPHQPGQLLRRNRP